MATFSIQSSPVGSQFVETISGDEPADLNDFDVFITSDENVTLTEPDVSVSSGSSIVAFSGSNASYKATIRPPETAGMVTVSIAANAVPEGNPAVSQDLSVLSTEFPRCRCRKRRPLLFTTSRVPFSLTELLSHSNRIFISSTRHQHAVSSADLYFASHDGTEQTSEQLTVEMILGFREQIWIASMLSTADCDLLPPPILSNRMFGCYGDSA